MAKRKLLVFGVGRLEQILAKGNVDYVRHYRAYFDEVVFAYLTGPGPSEARVGDVRLVSLGGSGDHYWLDLLLAPWRLLRFARAETPTSFLTADIFFSWWTGMLVRRCIGARVALMPVSIPPEIHRSTGRSMTGMPIAIEKASIHASFAAADRIVATVNGVAQREWIDSEPAASGKTIVARAQIEELPPLAFFEEIDASPRREQRDGPIRAIYVGRLHAEKLAADLIELMALVAPTLVGKLIVVGDGPLRETMQARAGELGVQDRLEWRGFVAHGELAALYAESDVFVSTVTGTSLREATLAGLPIAAYNADWAGRLLTDGETALVAPSGNVAALARAVEKLASNPSMRLRLAANARAMARSMWSPDIARYSLAQVFDRDAA
jgi:glycosyltransferase involved in cell wall biosynthesis